MLQHQDYYDYLLHGRNHSRCCSKNVSRPLKIIFNDTRGMFPVILDGLDGDGLLSNRYLSSYKSDFRKLKYSECNQPTNDKLERTLSDLTDPRKNKTAFRSWNIPSSIITGEFPSISKTDKEFTHNAIRSVETCRERPVEVKVKENPIKEKAKSPDKEELTISKLLEGANFSERRVILKSMFLSDPDILKFSLRQALMPDSEKKIKSWLNTAKHEEKNTAIHFFKRLLESKSLLPGDRNYIQHILEIMKEEEDYWITKRVHPQFVGDGVSKLKYINLQYPELRKQRWMYTTWNHMPPYRAEHTSDCLSSHYAMPHKLVHSTYKIHPDME